MSADEADEDACFTLEAYRAYESCATASL